MRPARLRQTVAHVPVHHSAERNDRRVSIGSLYKATVRIGAVQGNKTADVLESGGSEIELRLGLWWRDIEGLDSTDPQRAYASIRRRDVVRFRYGLAINTRLVL